MIVLGLTGPSGSGKGVLSFAFSKYGIPVLDTDKVYHAWIDEDTLCTRELAACFGEEILKSDKSIDRKRLAALVFGEDERAKERRELLNRITHKYVLESCRFWLAEQEKNGKKAAVLDAPLLIEAGLHKKCDYVIAVLAPFEVRLARIMMRDGISEQAAKARLIAQPQDDFYRAHADFLFINEKEPAAAEMFLRGVINSLPIA